LPKIYEYLNIAFFFYSNEHEPIHVHAGKGGKETVFEILIENAKVNKIKVRKVKGREHLESNDLKNALEFVELYSEKIVSKRVDFFVYRIEVKNEKFLRRL
jgi:Domain of unknown function (DUF4160)